MKKNTTTATVIKHARLDKTLVELFSLTRSQGQKLIADNRVTINGELPTKMGETVREGDKIMIRESSNLPILKSSVLEKKAERLEDYKIMVIAETPDYIVLNKPSGLLVHPTMAHETNTLAGWLLKKYPEVKKVGDDPTVRPGIVHRLDKEASGLLVVARTQKMFEHLKEQFKNRTIGKEYWTLVHGKVTKDWDEITFPIARSESADRMAARPLFKAKYVSTLAPKNETEATDEPIAPGEKQARTEFFVERRFINFTLLKIILHTGRMHQIRVHMLAYNHPLVGDPLYKQIKRRSKWDEKCGRLFLHSAKLSFTDLAGERQTFESPLPEILEEFLKLLK